MAKPSLFLLIEQGPKSGHCLQCKPRGRVTIGRARTNTLQISRDIGISQKHLAFCQAACSDEDDAEWSITDLGSSNGTLVNNLPIEPNFPVSIKAGDLIKIGAETTIRIDIPSSSAPETSKVTMSPNCKGVPEHADSHTKCITVSEEQKDFNKHIPPPEVNHCKDCPASVKHPRAGFSKARGGQEPQLNACKSSGQGIDLNMTVEQWFAHLMEEGPKYIDRVSESIIQDVLLESKEFDEYVLSLNQG